MDAIGFAGTGRMGRPMAELLCAAGYRVTVLDRDPSRAAQVVGARVAADLDELAAASGVLITMLPDGIAAKEVVTAAMGSLPAGAVVIDMSSSAPMGTVELGEVLRLRGVALIDAPVSGGVARAITGKLTIMAGGDEDDIERVRGVLETMGRVVKVGRLGAGHAMKALNNYVSAAGLAAACEALLLGQKFGLEGQRMLDVLNASTGQNFATSNKLAQFVLSGTFASGFALNLLAKDVRTAAELASGLHLNLPTLSHNADLWTRLEGELEAGADHTEMFRYLRRLNPED